MSRARRHGESGRLRLGLTAINERHLLEQIEMYRTSLSLKTHCLSPKRPKQARATRGTRGKRNTRVTLLRGYWRVKYKSPTTCPELCSFMRKHLWPIQYCSELSEFASESTFPSLAGRGSCH